MPDETIRLVGPDGVIEVPIEQAASALGRGYKVETDAGKLDRLSGEQREDTYGGIKGKVGAFATRAVGAATLGASDVLIDQLGGSEYSNALAEQNPGSALAGTITGAVLPVIPGVGSSAFAKALPGARAARIGTEVAELGAGAGLATRTGYNVAGAAIEGGLQNAGAYISDVALGNRELSAEGFTGAMGQGALWGGASAGALTLGSGALTAARRLFPKVEMTAASVAKVEREATEGISKAVDDGALLEQTASSRLAEIRTERAISDPEVAAKLDAIKVSKARELDAKVQTAGYRAESAEARAGQAKEAAERAKAGPKRGRKPAVEEGAEASGREVGGGGTTPATEASAVAEDVTGDTASLLERQLQGTRAALDSGDTLAQIGARERPAIGLKPASVEDALNAEIALHDPEAAKLVAGISELRESRGAVDEWLGKYKGGQVSKFERSEASRAYAEGMKPKAKGWYSSVPEGEGNVLGRRGKQMRWQGTEEERAVAESRINAKVDPEERAAIDQRFAKRQLADDIVESPSAPSVDEHVTEALKAKAPDISDDIAHAAPRINRFETASADLTETLGARAPSSAAERAQGLRDAQRLAEQNTQAATANATADMERASATIGLPGPEVIQPSKFGGIGGKVQDAGAAWQALHMMGVPLPDPHDIPVVGPLLSLYLKARVLGKAFGRFGGKVAETAEGAIAAKAAATKQRVLSAVDRMLDVGSKGLAKAAPKAGGTAAILGHVLFSDRERDGSKPYGSKPAKGELIELYQKRADELSAAMRPGAIRDSVRDRVRASDPTIVDAIVAAKERKLGYLNDHLPRQEMPVGPLGGSLMVWTPSKADLNSFARRVEAAEDPASVLENAAAGGAVSIEAAETLKAVYPLMFQEAQKRLLQQSVDRKIALPYSRRLQLSVLFDLPLDSSMDPEYGAFLQEGYKPPPPPMQPQPMMGAPTIASDVNSAARVDPSTRSPT